MSTKATFVLGSEEWKSSKVITESLEVNVIRFLKTNQPRIIECGFAGHVFSHEE